MFRFVFASVFFLCFGSVFLCASRAAAQQTQQQEQRENQQLDERMDQSTNQSQSMVVSDVRLFSGKITKKLGKFYLEDHLHKRTFILDNDWLVQRHLGASVFIKGVLDEERNVIHVRSIVNVPSKTANPPEHKPSQNHKNAFRVPQL
jgi:hypothetical protein